MRKVYALILLLVIGGAKVVAQEDDVLRDAIELLNDEDESDFEYDGVAENLEIYLKHPINLNKTNAAELNDLGILNDLQLQEILTHIDLYGSYMSLYELQTVPSLDQATIKQILPFIKINSSENDEHLSIKQLLTKGDYMLLGRYQQVLEKQKGYALNDTNETKGYLGDPYKLYVRFRYSFGTKFSYGITAEKDQGEEFFKGSQKQGFDYYSGHLFIRDVKFFKAVALGDYEIRLGQGLVIYNGFAIGKSTEAINVKRDGKKIKPYTSVNEYNFMRGAATTLGLKNFELTLFGSYRQLDGNITAFDTLTEKTEEISSIGESGLHRTLSEVADRNAFNMYSVGGNFSYNKRKWHLGVNALYNKLNTEVKRSDATYNKFAFEGNKLFNASLDYHYLYKNFHFFGETALSDNLAVASLNGLMIGLGRHADMAVVYRYYDKQYQSIYANAFGELSSPQNENGLYVGTTVRPHQQITINAYFDYFNHPWLRYLVDAPSHGYEGMLQVSYKPSKKIELYIRYKHELKQFNAPENETKTNYLIDENRDKIRFHINCSVSKAVKLSSRVEASFLNNPAEGKRNGFMLYQDVDYRPLSFPVSFSGRIAYFDAPDYDARIYAYEDDVLYAFSIPAYYNQGFRYYGVVKYRIVKGVEVWLRVAQTQYTNIKTVGTGNEEIDKAHKTEIKAQLRLKF